ncbi:unnamed protein product [Calicophoron daubneyi]|uniref:Uncharacterized protein n=1 Tax=Calicophoron daubneyi TaxID=300641 RepID=A0AAV2TWK1_CALDB
MKCHKQVNLQTNCNNSYGLEQIEILKRLPPLHKIHRSLRHFANLSDLNCQRYGLLRRRDGNRNSDTKVNQLTKEWTKIEADTVTRPKEEISKGTDFALSLTRLNENHPESERVDRRSCLDPLHSIDQLLCALDERALQVEKIRLSEKNTDQNRIFCKLNLERMGEDKESLMRRRQLQYDSSMNNLWSKQSITDMEAGYNFRSPRTCVDSVSSSEDKQKTQHISDRRLEPNRRPRLIPPAIICPTKYETVGLQLSPGTLQDPKKLGETYERLLKQLHQASLRDLQEEEDKKAKALKTPVLVYSSPSRGQSKHNSLGTTNASNITITRERVRVNRSDSVSSGTNSQGGGSGVVPMVVRRAVGAMRDRRQSLYALHQLRMATQKRLNEEWEEDLSRSSGARKLKIVFLAVKFLNILLQGYRVSHRLTNPLLAGSLRGFVQPDSFDVPLEAPDYMCPLLQATVSSYPYFGSQQKTGGDPVTIIDDLIAPPPEIPTYLASLQIGEKRPDIIDKNKPASEKGGKKTVMKKRTNIIARKRPSIGGSQIRRSVRSSRSRPVDNQLEYHDPAMKAARIKRRLQEIICRVTENYVNGAQLRDILSLQLIKILADNIRDQCRDLLRISHSCKECHCRDEDIGDLPIEKVRDPASFSVIVMTHVVEKKNQSVMIATRCFREAPMDDYLTYTHEDYAYAVIIVVYLFRKYFVYKNDPKKFEANPGLNTLYKYWLNDKISWVERPSSANKNDETST